MDRPSELSALSLSFLSDDKGGVPSAGEEEVVRLFDSLRLSLLRYLLAFPLPVSDAEDIIQEAFLSLFSGLRKGGKYRNVSGWLFKAVHHLALKKRLRSRVSTENTTTLGDVESTLVDPSPGPEDELAFAQLQRRLASVVQALPDQHRWCLYLRAEGLRYREISEIVGISLGSVSIYLERSLALIERATQR